MFSSFLPIVITTPFSRPFSVLTPAPERRCVLCTPLRPPRPPSDWGPLPRGGLVQQAALLPEADTQSLAAGSIEA